MAHLQLKIICQFEYANGNSNRNTIPVTMVFRTEDSFGKSVYFNQSRACELLINKMLDMKFTTSQNIVECIIERDNLSWIEWFLRYGPYDQEARDKIKELEG